MARVANAELMYGELSYADRYFSELSYDEFRYAKFVLNYADLSNRAICRLKLDLER